MLSSLALNEKITHIVNSANVHKSAADMAILKERSLVARFFFYASPLPAVLLLYSQTALETFMMGLFLLLMLSIVAGCKVLRLSEERLLGRAGYSPRIQKKMRKTFKDFGYFPDGEGDEGVFNASLAAAKAGDLGALAVLSIAYREGVGVSGSYGASAALMELYLRAGGHVEKGLIELEHSLDLLTEMEMRSFGLSPDDISHVQEVVKGIVALFKIITITDHDDHGVDYTLDERVLNTIIQGERKRNVKLVKTLRP